MYVGKALADMAIDDVDVVVRVGSERRYTGKSIGEESLIIRRVDSFRGSENGKNIDDDRGSF